MRFKAVTLGLVLAGTSLGSHALTLGKARGAAWIGQPLELKVPVQRDSTDSDGALCAEADVYHGDARQDRSRVRVQTESGSGADAFNVRISSTTPVDEPVVTVYVRVGCTQKSQRKFVLLADFQPEPLTPVTRAAPVTPVVPLVTPSALSQDITPAATSEPKPAPAPAPIAETRLAPPAPSAKPKEAPRVAVTTESKVRKEVLVPKPSKPAAKAENNPERAAPIAKGNGKPRLRLDPVETLAERVANLEATTTQAALQDDLAKDAQKMQQLQNDLRSLLDQAVKNEASLAAMRERLEKAEADRVPLSLVYGLVALVALSLGALAFLLTQKNRSFPWERNAANPPEEAPTDAASGR